MGEGHRFHRERACQKLSLSLNLKYLWNRFSLFDLLRHDPRPRNSLWYCHGDFNLRESDQRILKDRRVQPTPALSRYTFFGRRKEIRRRSERLKGGYVDRYSSGTLFLVVSIIGLNVLDALFTIMILELKGLELNPVVQAVMTTHGDNFWIWKFFIVSIPLTLLCLHSKFRPVKTVLVCICMVYIAVVAYEIALMIRQ